MDAAVLDPVAENGIGLRRAAAVQGAVFFSLAAPHAGTILQSYIGPDYFVEHIDYLRVVDQNARRPTRDVPVLRRQ